VSATGSLVYIPEQPFNLMLLDHEGRREIIGEGRRFHNPRFSPDGSQLAIDFSQQGSRDVWSLDLRQKTLTRLTFENDGHDAIWSPDGRYLAYVSRVGIFRRRADGSGVAESLYVAPFPTGPLAFTPDGSTLITSPTNINGSFDIGLLPMGDERVEQSFIATPFNEQFVALSPDGRWMAYCSDETGLIEVYVRSFPEGGSKILVSLDGGSEPRWSPDGRQLYYIGTKDNAPYLISARVSTGGAFTVQDRTALFDMSEFEPAAPHANWDVSPDGSRFAVVHQGALSEMVFVLNWTEEVRQR
jgi:Tol biopolymer transport system component